MSYVPRRAASGPIFAGLRRPLLFAHRGASALAPENTLAAFDLALRLGAQVLEMDVHLSADGEPVVIHDADVARTTNGTGKVAELTYAQLEALDAGCRFATRSGARPFAGRDVVVPRLADVVDTFAQAAFNIEVKAARPGLIEKVAQICARLPAHRVVLAAEDDAIMAALEAQPGNFDLGLSTGQVRRVCSRALFGRTTPLFDGRAAQIPASYCGLPLAARHAVRAMQRSGLEVHAWVVNHPPAAAALLRRGVDGIMTDDPSLLTPLFAPVAGSSHLLPEKA